MIRTTCEYCGWVLDGRSKIYCCSMVIVQVKKQKEVLNANFSGVGDGWLPLN